MKRYALVASKNTQWDDMRVVARYLPDNFKIVCIVGREHLSKLSDWARIAILIEGEDYSGWTLDGYVIPRLASGTIMAEEIDLSHPALKHAYIDDLAGQPIHMAVIIDGAMPRSEKERAVAVIDYAANLLGDGTNVAEGVKVGEIALKIGDIRDEIRKHADDQDFEFWNEVEDDAINVINDLLPEGWVCGVGINEIPGDVIITREVEVPS